MKSRSVLRRRTQRFGTFAVATMAGVASLAAAPMLTSAAAADAAPKPAASKVASAVKGLFPVVPPAQVCGNAALLTGPASAPAGAITVAPGDNSTIDWNQPGATFYLATGTHTLGNGQYSQIMPADNTTFLGAPGAIIDGGGVNQYAFTQLAANVTIRYLTVQNFIAPRDQGVVNHDSGAGWTIQYNTIADNAGAGVMVGPGDLIAYNCLKANGQYGFSAYKAGGDANIIVDHNEITANNTGNWDVVVPGCGCVGAAKLWDTTGAQITNNWVHNNIGPGIWADTNNTAIVIDSNYINDNDDEAIIYEISYNAQITNNTIIGNAIVKGKTFANQGTNFPVAAIYISESGGDTRVNNGLDANFTIAGNNLIDNWGGVTLWENADRFCNSPANTSATFCTLAPAANFTTCVAGTINNNPYLTDCRWKTQNIAIHDNQFAFSKANVGCTTSGCGVQAIISNYGTTPSWSPYLGNTVINTIATAQGNHFANNTYTGDWTFAAGGSAALNFASWQGSMYGQDPGSTFNGSSGSPTQPNNLLDADTSSLEGSVGHWASWFSANVAQAATVAQTGTHSLQVNITAPYGWGIQTNNWPGFTATPGPQTISFWAMAPTAGLNATMAVQWRGTNSNVLATTTATINNLTTTWQQGTTNVTAPPATTYASVTITGTTGVAGNTVYLDHITIAPGTTTPPPPATNVLDADTATLENSTGRWAPWFSTTTAQNATTAQQGTHSLQVNITAPYGWGIQTNNWPGFTATPGPQTISFWAMAATAGLNATMAVQWRDTTGNVLATTTAAHPTLTTTWQQATTTATAPPATAYASVTITGTTGVAGNSLNIDHITVAPPTTTNTTNLLDTDTATLENSTGRWAPWFSTTTAQNATTAQQGTHSLQVNITAPYGWGIQTNNWPGFTATPGPQTISFWATAAATGLNATMAVQWRDTTGNVLATTTAAVNTLTTTWQQATTTATAPPATAYASVTVTGTTGVAGNTIYLDNIYLGS
jgi:hypothetical protein